MKSYFKVMASLVFVTVIFGKILKDARSEGTPFSAHLKKRTKRTDALIDALDELIDALRKLPRHEDLTKQFPSAEAKPAKAPGNAPESGFSLVESNT